MLMLNKIISMFFVKDCCTDIVVMDDGDVCGPVIMRTNNRNNNNNNNYHHYYYCGNRIIMNKLQDQQLHSQQKHLNVKDVVVVDDDDDHHHHHESLQCHPTIIKTVTKTITNNVPSLTSKSKSKTLSSTSSSSSSLLLSIKSHHNNNSNNEKYLQRQQRLWHQQCPPLSFYNKIHHHQQHQHDHCLYNCSMFFFLFMFCSMFFLNKTVISTNLNQLNNNNNTSTATVSRLNSASSSVSATRAEYFYAQDKLSDAQVEQFLQSLSNQTTINNRNRIAINNVQQQQPSQQSLPSIPSSSLIRRPLPPPTSSTTNSFSLVTTPTIVTPSNSTAITSTVNDNISAAKYLSSSKQHSSSIQNRDSDKNEEKFSDISQWLRPVYVPPKRSSSSSSSSMSNHQPPSSQETVVLFGSSQLDSNGFPSSHFNSSTNDNRSSEIFEDIQGSQSSTTTSSLWTNVTFQLKDEQWVAPVIALSTLNMLVIFGFECFVIYRACRTCPSRRHLFLGQMLLLGLFLSSAMGLAFVPKSSWLSCTIIRAGLGISYTIVYASLLVKTIFLLSLHTGVYLPAEYQALLLFFIISTQVAIDVQWLVHWRSSTVIDYWDGFGQAVYRCDHTQQQLLWSLSYVIVLIVILAIMTFRIRGYRENHGEALFLGIVSIAQIVVWLVWIAGTMTSTPHYRDGFVAFGIVGNATVIFTIMFLPKGRQLAAFGNGGGSGRGDGTIDQISTASSPSMYAPPSFLHLKAGPFVPLTKSSSIVGGYGQTHAHHLQSHHHHQTNLGTGGGNSIGKSGRSSSAAMNSGAYHLYQKFGTQQNPTITTTATDHLGTNSTTATTQNQKFGSRMSNSFSSHAILNSYQRASSQDPQQQQREQDDDDPNYSNLSNIFTTSTMAAVSSSNDGSKTSPLSENISSHSSSGSSSHNNNNQSQHSNSRPPSIPKTKRPSLMMMANGQPPSQQQQLKSPNDIHRPDQDHGPPPPPLPLARNAGGGFFYLQPPPLPPPPPPTTNSTTNASTNNSVSGVHHSDLTTPTGQPKMSSNSNHVTTPTSTTNSNSSTAFRQQQQQQSQSQWRQSCYTSSFGHHIPSNNNRHYYPGPKSGSYHPSLPPVPSTPTGGLTTPIGHVPPPQLISPTELVVDRSCSGSSTGFYFTPQFDQLTNHSNHGGNKNGRQVTTPTSQTSQTTNNSNGAINGQNFKYFRGNPNHHNHY